MALSPAPRNPSHPSGGESPSSGEDISPGSGRSCGPCKSARRFRSRPAATPSTCDETCSPTTRAPCALSSSAQSAPAGDPRYRRGVRVELRAPASSATAPNVTEISLDNCERVHIDRIVFVLDCGITINPDLVRAQVEGGVLFGLSAAAWGEVVLGRRRRDRHPELRPLPDCADALRPADRDPPDRVDRVTHRGRRGRRPLSRPSPGERNRSPHRHPNPQAPLSKTIKIH